MVGDSGPSHRGGAELVPAGLQARPLRRGRRSAAGRGLGDARAGRRRPGPPTYGFCGSNPARPGPTTAPRGTARPCWRRRSGRRATTQARRSRTRRSRASRSSRATRRAGGLGRAPTAPPRWSSRLYPFASPVFNYFRESMRVLKPGGRFMLPAAEHAGRRATSCAFHHFTQPYFVKHPYPMNFYSPVEIVSLLPAPDFCVAELERRRWWRWPARPGRPGSATRSASRAGRRAAASADPAARCRRVLGRARRDGRPRASPRPAAARRRNASRHLAVPRSREGCNPREARVR